MTIYVYIFVIALVTYLLRAVPLVLFRKPIKSRFVRSFLYYVPYACLAAMIFPAILSDAPSVASAVIALAVSVLFAVREKSLIVVALGSSAAVLLTEWVRILLH